MPVRFPAKTPGPVPFNRVPEFPGKGKTNPIIGQVVFQDKKFSAPVTEALSPAENGPYLVPSL
jgi:hypothetical protein